MNFKDGTKWSISNPLARTIQYKNPPKPDLTAREYKPTSPPATNRAMQLKALKNAPLVGGAKDFQRQAGLRNDASKGLMP